MRVIRLESHSSVKTTGRAAVFAVLPSVPVRLHVRLSTKLGNCPVTAPARTDHLELEKE